MCWELSCYQIWVRTFPCLCITLCCTAAKWCPGWTELWVFWVLGCTKQVCLSDLLHRSWLYLLRPLPAWITVWSWDPTFHSCRAVAAAPGNPFLHPMAEVNWLHPQWDSADTDSGAAHLLTCSYNWANSSEQSWCIIFYWQAHNKNETCMSRSYFCHIHYFTYFKKLSFTDLFSIWLLTIL